MVFGSLETLRQKLVAGGRERFLSTYRIIKLGRIGGRQM
jgi:hypothetical protein